MNYDCLNILKWTEAQLKYTYDVSLKEATPQELHEALGNAVMMAISDNWNHSKHTRMPDRKAYYISAEYLIGPGLFQPVQSVHSGRNEEAVC